MSQRAKNVSRTKGVPRLDRMTRRRDDIAEMLESAGRALSATDVANELRDRPEYASSLSRTSFLRNVQRDLAIMERLGRVQKAGEKWESVNQDGQFVFESLAGAVALDLLLKTSSWAMPEELLEQLGNARATVAARLKNAYSGNPAVRWLKSLRHDEHPVFNLERPVVNEEVRQAVEQAILESRRIRLWTGSTGQAVAGRTMQPWVISISHYILKLPDMPAIGYWSEQGEYHEHGLEKFTRAEVLDEPASLPFDPADPRSRPRNKPAPLEIEVIADRMAMSRLWKHKGISKHLAVLRANGDGSTHCRFEAPYSPELIRFLANDGMHVEVLSPGIIRDMVYEKGLALVARYSASNAALRREAIAEWRQLDCYLGD